MIKKALFTNVIILLCFFFVGCANPKIDKESTSDISNVWAVANKAYSDRNWQVSYDSYHKLKDRMVDAEVEFRYGVSAYRLNKIKEAESAFFRAVEISPNHQKALFNLALISLSKGHYYLYRYVNSLPKDMQSERLKSILKTLEEFSSD